MRSLLKPSWIFLDFDNTLMGTECLTTASLVNRFNAIYGTYIKHPLTCQCFEVRFQGKTRQSLCESLSDYFNIYVDYEVLYESRAQDVVTAFRENLVEMAPDVIETLNEAHKYYELALVTNSTLHQIFSAMRWASNGRGSELAQLFGTSFFESGTIPKPKPDVYLYAMHQLNATPQQCIAVEDSIPGASAAISAGIKTFG
ncbi:HAD family hydrolase, partial [Holospora curviuscula]|uniref:HAD family hydrolase n=1 Tax=Holospora curviuscula TaxID=1082868 RepID=UPI00101AD40C